MSTVTYYFAPVSGFAYLGHRAFLDLAAAAGAEVIFRPIDIQALFAAQGTVPPPAQGAARLSYRRADMARWAARRGLPLNPTPAHWPVPAAPSARVLLAAAALGHDVGRCAEAMLHGIWAEDRKLDAPGDLAAILQDLGLPAQSILAEADTPPIFALLERNTAEAGAAGVFGSPTYVIDGERFFGQDRLDFVADALAAAAVGR